MACDQKKAEDTPSTVVFVDESSFRLLPLCVRTFAPRGQTPILRVPLAHPHLSVISAISLQGACYAAIQSTAFTSTTVIAFLHQLLDQIPGHVTVLWDGAPIHRSQAIKSFLAEGAAHRLHLERLPAYAPDLNPDEGVWSWLKRRLKNCCFPHITALQHAVQEGMTYLQQHTQLVARFFHACPYLL